MKLVLLTLATYMNREGYAFPSQETIASGAALSDRSVRDKLNLAARLGWLIIDEDAGRTGQGWRRHGYWTSTPEAILMSVEHEELTEHNERTIGE